MFISNYLLECSQINDYNELYRDPNRRPLEMRLHLLALGIFFSAYAIVTHSLRAIDELIISFVRLDCNAFRFSLIHLAMIPFQGVALVVLGVTNAIFGETRCDEFFRKIEQLVYHYKLTSSEFDENFSVTAPPHTMQCGYVTGPVLSLTRGLLVTVNNLVKVIFFTVSCAMNAPMNLNPYKVECQKQLGQAMTSLVECVSQGMFKGIYSSSYRETLFFYTQPEAL